MYPADPPETAQKESPVCCTDSMKFSTDVRGCGGLKLEGTGVASDTRCLFSHNTGSRWCNLAGKRGTRSALLMAVAR